MKDHFENKIKEKMNQLSFEETGLNPDKEAIWNNINDKNKLNAAKRIKFKSVISHAAALLIGILISATLLLFNFNKQNKSINNYVTGLDSSKGIPLEIATKTDTIFIEKTVVVEKTEKIKQNKIQDNILNNKATVMYNETKITENIKITIPEDYQEKTLSHKQKKPISKVKEIVYWSDIQNNYHNTGEKEKQSFIATILRADENENESSNNTPPLSPFIAFSKSFKNN